MQRARGFFGSLVVRTGAGGRAALAALASRRRVLHGLAFCGLLSCGLVSGGLASCGRDPGPDSAGGRGADARPNLLVYMVDTLRADELGCYGAAITETPAIDSFAAGGTLFERASSPSANTRASVASLFTGLPPFIHGAENNRTDLTGGGRALVRLAELLRDAGYSTAAVVSNPNVASLFGYDAGFDTYVELYEQRTEAGPAMPHELDARAPRVVREVREVIAALPADRPWFVFALSIDPHSPYMPPGDYATRYDPDVERSAGSLRAIIEFDQRIAGGERPSAAAMQALYRGEVTFADEHFGRLLGWLEEQGLREETLVVFTSDHGEEFVEHGLRGHGKAVFEESTHVPLVFSHPALFPSARRSERVDLLDLAATLAGIGGATPPRHWPGRDLRHDIAPRPIVSTQRNSEVEYAAVRLDPWKLIADDRRGTSVLYDLSADPREQAPLTGGERARAAEVLDPLLADFRTGAERLRSELLDGGVGLTPEDLPDDVLESLRRLGYLK